MRARMRSCRAATWSQPRILLSAFMHGERRKDVQGQMKRVKFIIIIIIINNNNNNKKQIHSEHACDKLFFLKKS